MDHHHLTMCVHIDLSVFADLNPPYIILGTTSMFWLKEFKTLNTYVTHMGIHTRSLEQSPIFLE